MGRHHNMAPDDSNPDPPQRDRLLELIAAVALGDAAREDVVAALRDEGIDALDVAIVILQQAARSGADAHARQSRFVNPHRSVSATPAGPDARIEHREPKLPFLMRGTLYDPTDIERFQGQELHFIPAPRGDHIIVIDDTETMIRWWQLSYLSANTESPSAGVIGVQTMPPTWNPQQPPPHNPDVPPPPPTEGPEGFGTATAPGGPPRTIFYEHDNYQGSDLELDPNRGYYDLRKVGLGFLGLDDWNDKISSIQLVNTRVAVLHDHIHWTGATCTSHGALSLEALGWNDRASSVETW